MTEAELRPPAGDDIEDAGAQKRDRNQTGIEDVLRHLGASLGQQKPVQKCETLEKFFESTQHRRRRAERMADWLVRFEAGLQLLRENVMDLNALGDVVGWFLLWKAGLTAERRERVVGNLPGEHCGFQRIRGLQVRMFPDVHAAERHPPPPRPRQGQSRHRGGG